MSWPEVRLGDHLQFLTSGSRGWSKYVRDDGALFVRIQNVGKNALMLDDVAYVNPPGGAESVRTKVEVGDVLLSITADLGRTAVVPPGLGDAYISQHLAIIRTKSFHPEFLASYISLGPGFAKLAKLDKGGVKSGLNFDDVKSLTVPLPPLPEQKRIAAILDKADEIRRKRAEAIKLTEELLKSAFLEMFGDPVTNPKGWPVRKLGDTELCQVQGGLQVTRARDTNPIEIPYLRVANVYRDRLKLDEIKTIRVTESELDRIRLVDGDVLIVEGHGNPEEIGRSSVWNNSIPDCVHQNHLIRVRCTKSCLSPTYLSAFLNSNGGRRQLIGFGKTTSGLNTISASNVRAVEIPLPSHGLQQQFERFVFGLARLENDESVHSTSVDLLTGGLTQSAFRGEL